MHDETLNSNSLHSLKGCHDGLAGKAFSKLDMSLQCKYTYVIAAFGWVYAMDMLEISPVFYHSQRANLYAHNLRNLFSQINFIYMVC